jgi:pimeloyl-ACP methyl ester carboxylesterase
MVTSREIPPWLARLYPFEPRSFLTPGGARMSYLDEGPQTDEAVLLIHGNPTWSFYFRDLVRDLAPALRCIVPDHVGMGLSDKPSDYDYSLASRIADLGALVASLGLKRVHLVVHDWGGAIGCGWAVKHVAATGRLVLLNTAAFPSPRVPVRIAVCRLPVIGEALVRGLNAFAGPATRMAMRARHLTSDERGGYLFPYDSWAHRIGVHRFVRDIPLELNHPTRPLIEEIARELPRLLRQPKLIVWGGRDFCFNAYFLARWLDLFPHAEVDLRPEAGHYVLEDGGASVRERIREFLQRPDSS